MSRAQKQVRLNIGTPASEGGSANQYPDVTQMDSAKNVAGDVTRTSTDDYVPQSTPTITL